MKRRARGGFFRSIRSLLIVTLLTPGAGASEPTIHAVDAALRCLELDPAIASARARARLLDGILLSESGAFDSSLSVQASIDHRRAELTSQALAQEENKRNALRLLIQEFTEIADDLERQLAESDGRAFADCGDNEIFIDGVAVCSSDQERAGGSSYDALLDLLGASPRFGDALSQLDDNLVAASRASTQLTIDVFRATAAGTQVSLDRLGLIPSTEESTTVKLDLTAPMPFRNGMVFSPSLMLEGVEDNFSGKEKSSALGGKGIQNTFTSQVRLSLSIPVLRGYGRRFTTAPERSAQLEYRAGQADVRHVASQRVLATLEAFWRLYAAQERVRLLEASESTQERLSDISRALAEADLAPRRDLSRAAAELAGSRVAVAGARRTLAAARLDLARTIGLDVERLFDAPLAAGSFPGMPEAFTGNWTRPLIEESVIGRHDLAAARFRREASRIRREAAEQELRPQLDLDLTVGYLGLEERASVGRGFFGSLSEDIPGLSAVFGLKLDWPVRNRVAEGRLSQAAALQRRLAVAARELERRIRNQVAESAGRLERAVAELHRREQTAELYEQTHAASIELFQAGEGTLLDTLITEQRLTGARLALITARERWATLLARLRFQSGSLVSFDGDEPQIADLTGLPLLGS